MNNIIKKISCLEDILNIKVALFLIAVVPQISISPFLIYIKYKRDFILV